MEAKHASVKALGAVIPNIDTKIQRARPSDLFFDAI